MATLISKRKRDGEEDGKLEEVIVPRDQKRSTVIPDSTVLMTNSSECSEVNGNEYTRRVECEFLLGPNRISMPLSVENVKTIEQMSFDEECRFECELAMKEGDEEWPVSTDRDRKDWEDFRIKAGIVDDRSCDQFFFDTVMEMIGCITKKHGVLDMNGTSLGVDADEMVEEMMLSVQR